MDRNPWRAMYPKTPDTPWVWEPDMCLIGPGVLKIRAEETVTRVLGSPLPERLQALLHGLGQCRLLSRRQMRRVWFADIHKRTMVNKLTEWVDRQALAEVRWGPTPTTPAPLSLRTPCYTLGTLGVSWLATRSGYEWSQRPVGTPVTVLPKTVDDAWRWLIANELWSQLAAGRHGPEEGLIRWQIRPRWVTQTGQAHHPVAAFTFARQRQHQRFAIEVVRGDHDVARVADTFAWYAAWGTEQTRLRIPAPIVIVVAEQDSQIVRLVHRLAEAGLYRQVPHLYTTDLRLMQHHAAEPGAFVGVARGGLQPLQVSWFASGGPPDPETGKEEA